MRRVLMPTFVVACIAVILSIRWNIEERSDITRSTREMIFRLYHHEAVAPLVQDGIGPLVDAPPDAESVLIPVGQDQRPEQTARAVAGADLFGSEAG